MVWDHTENINSGDWNGCASEKYTRYNNKAYDIVGSKNFNNPGNERAIRYSDVLLMLAECNLRGTSVDEGAARINKDKYSGWDAMDIYMPIFVNEITATGLSEYPDASDYAGLYPGVIDNTLESCRVN